VNTSDWMTVLQVFDGVLYLATAIITLFGSIAANKKR
jgi:hypothetical protein